MATTAQVQLIIPTAINVLTAVNEVLITRKRAGLTPDITLPSLRRRALLIVKEAGTLAIQMSSTSQDSDYNR
jgi:hypothetical protein